MTNVNDADILWNKTAMHMQKQRRWTMCKSCGYGEHPWSVEPLMDYKLSVHIAADELPGEMQLKLVM